MLYEFRYYTVNQGKMQALKDHFGNITTKFFEKHGIKSIGYFTNTVGGRSDEFVYILGYRDMAHREQAWGAFQADPEWIATRAQTEVDGPLVHHVENRFMVPTDYSPLN